MDRNQSKKLLPIIHAYAEGKTIQSRCIKGDTSLWYDDEDPSFDNDFEYRIKPESKYRPFKDSEECWNEMLKHQPFGYVYFPDDNLYHNIIMLAPEQGCHEAYIRIGNCTVRGLEEAFRIFTFADGLPFGVKAKED